MKVMTMQDERQDEREVDLKEPAPAYLFTLMAGDSVERVVKAALEGRDRLPGEFRDVLNRAINSLVAIPGFRFASAAPPPLALRQVCDRVPLSEHLGTLLLGAWFESQTELREAVAAALAAAGVALRDLDTVLNPLEPVRRRNRVWDALDAYQEEHPEQDAAEVKLMAQLLAGQALLDAELTPEEADQYQDYAARPVGQLLDATLTALSGLSPADPVWESAIPDFAAALAGLAERKGTEREAAATLENLLAEIRAEHAGLLEFFQWDDAGWIPGGSSSRGSSSGSDSGKQDGVPAEVGEIIWPAAQARATELQELLAQYAPLHERAPVAAEELARAAQRLELLPRVVATGENLRRLLRGEGETEAGEQYGDSGGEDDDVDPDPGRGAGRVVETMIGESSAAGSRADGPGPMPACDIDEYLRLRLDNQDLEAENGDLEEENAGLKEEVKSLKQQLFDSRQEGESWRMALAYQERADGEEEPPELADVSAAVQLAEDRYGDRLLFRFNSESEAESSAFKWPEQVWKALRWLATDYYQSHLGLAPILDMDEACRSACGMWYKTGQHETTMAQYRNSYTTRVEGRIIWLGEHIGKGNSFDPRRTIRIAFDWDKQLQKVVVGYIGQHQRTSAT